MWYELLKISLRSKEDPWSIDSHLCECAHEQGGMAAGCAWEFAKVLVQAPQADSATLKSLQGSCY